MREESSSENRVRSLKFADQNQVKTGSQPSRLRSASSWGSHIVKGFSADKKNKLQITAAAKKLPLTSSDIVNQKNNPSVITSHSRVKRSLIGDLSCPANATLVHPQVDSINRTKSSRDLFLELEHLRSLLQESKERELQLQAELLECKRSPETLDLERQLEEKQSEVDELSRKVKLLESEKTSISEQLSGLTSSAERQEEVVKREELGISSAPSQRTLEMEVVELRRLNKELQLQKRNLSCRLSSLESQMTTLSKVYEV